MAEETPPDVPSEPADNAPLRERVESKTWKTRMEAFVELAKVFEDAKESEDVLREYVGLLHKFVSDSNVNAQDKGIEACCAFAKSAPVALAKQAAGSVMSKLVDKAFGQAKCKPKAQELALALIEAEAGEEVTDGLIAGCAHKQPKIAGAASECLRMAVQSFGLRALGPQSKAIVKLSVTMFDSTVQPVRAEALLLAVELHKYMGVALRPSYNDLRTAQQKEIDDAFAVAEKPAPSRMTRSAAAAFAARPPAADGAPANPTSSPASDVDALEFLEAVDVLGKLPKDFNDAVLTLPKWTEKKEVLDKLLEAANSPKIQPGDFHELVKTLKKLMTDPMVVLVANAVTAAGLLAHGLRKDFSQYSKLLLPTLLDRLKEKDFRVRDAVHATLDKMIGTGKCVALPDVLDDFTTALGPKGNPKAKVEVCKFLQSSIQAKASQNLALKAIKPLTDVLVKAADDSAPEVRDGASAVLGVLLDAFGSDSMKKVLESLDDKKRKKVESLAAAGKDKVESVGAESGAGAGAGKPTAPTAGAPAPTVKLAAAKPPAKTVGADAAAGAASGSVPKRTVGKVAVSKPAGAAGAGAGAGAGKTKGADKPEAASEGADLNAGMPVEELDVHIETLFPEATRNKLGSSNWKERVEGMDEVYVWLQEQETLQQPAPDATCRMIVNATKKETNFQVMAKAFAIVQHLAEKAVKFSKRAAHWMTGTLVEKLGDVKLKVAASDCLLALAEACTPIFIITQAIEVLEKQKAPKTLENGLLWMQTMCGDFGMKLVKPKLVLDFVKKMLEVANPAVKKAGVEVLVTLRRLLGADVRNLLTDIKPALLATIDEAFAKVSDDTPAEGPKRQLRGYEAECGGAAAGGGGAGCGGGEVVNLTGPIAGQLKALGDANWKERQAAITAIQDIVIKAKPLGCQGPYMEGACGELWAALKARLKDSNKNLATQVLVLLGKIADAVGPSVDKYARHVMANMLALISDNKKTVRDAVLACLSAWSAHIAGDTLIKYLPVALTVESPAGREDAFKWAADYLSARDKSEAVDLSPILNAVMEGLVFRVAEVRQGAERCLSAIYECGGKGAINNLLRDMKPAQLKGIKPICEKAEKAALALAACAGKQDAKETAAAAPPLHQPAAPPATTATAAVSEAQVEARMNSLSPAPEPLVVVVAKSAPPPELREAAVCESVVDEGLGKLLRCNRGKELRDKKYGKTKWVMDDAKEVEELIACVREQMVPVSDVELHAKLFNKDFKKQVDGIRELTAFAPENAQEVIDNLDLLLKMSSLRMVQKACNTSVLLSVLELLKSLMELCVASSYCLTDSEAQVILPVLLQEMGSNNEGIRAQIRDVVKKATHVYPASKIFSLAMDGAVATRNQRSRAEVLTEMTALIDRLGLEQVCMPAKALPVIAGFIAERDALVRNAACDCVAAAYSSMGDKMWKYIDKKLDAKDKDILEARLKKVKPPSAAAPGSKAAAADMRRSMPEMHSTTEKPAADKVLRASSSSIHGACSRPASSCGLTPQRGGAKQEVTELLEAPTPTISNIRSRFQDEDCKELCGGTSTGLAGESAKVESIFTEAMRDVMDGDVDEQLAGFRTVAERMEQVETRVVEASVNQLASSVQMVLANVLAKQERGTADVRLAKHAIHAMYTAITTSEGKAALALKDANTARLLEEFLLLSADVSLTTQPDANGVIAALNEVVVEMLRKANANHCFTSLIRFLYEGAPLSGERLPSFEFVDGVLRCLLEMAKNIGTFLQQKLDVDMLLYDCHMFLVSHPPSKYRGKEFRPLRLLKTILNELVKLKGQGIRQHLSLVPVETKPTLCSYIELVLQQHVSARTQPPADKPAGKVDIAYIFEKIGSKDKEVAKEGFKLLHQYQLEDREFNLDHFLAGRSPLFKEHVHKNLQKVAANLAAALPATSTPTALQALSSSSSMPQPLQPSSVANMSNRDVGDSRTGVSKGPASLMDKLQGLRTTTLAASAASQECKDLKDGCSKPAPASKFDTPLMGGLTAEGRSAGGTATPQATAAAGETGGPPDVRASLSLSQSQTVLSLQERLARLRA